MKNIHIVFNGTDLRRFSPSPNGVRPDLEFGPQMIFACRQLFPRKGIRFLIEAAAKIKPRFPALKVVIAGDGFERPDPRTARDGARHRERRHLPRLGAERRPAAVLSCRRALGYSLPRRRLRHSGGGGDGMRDAGRRDRRGRVA